jgi:hypothetical protein
MRLSATKLESFRLFCTADWMRLDQVIASMRDEVEVSDSMRVGSAFEACVNDNSYYQEFPSRDGFTFCGKHIANVQRTIPLSGAIQPKVEKKLMGCTVVGKADYIYGLTCHDLKATFSPIDGDKYSDSLQWKVYCWLFKCQSFFYDIAFLKPKNGVYYVHKYDQLIYRPYPGMVDEISSWVSRTSQFVEALDTEG